MSARGNQSVSSAPDAHAPGDNPNKQNAQRRKSYRPRKQNAPAADKGPIEHVDPLKEPLNIEIPGFQDRREPGTRTVGEFVLRPQFVDELISMAQNVVEAAKDALVTRIAVPELAPPLSIATRLIIASQLYESLQHTQEEGFVYKLKALKYMRLQVPAFLVPLVQTIGTYQTSEGIMRVRNAETMLVNLVQSAFQTFHNEERDLDGWENIDPGTTYLWETNDVVQVVHDRVKSVIKRCANKTALIAGTGARFRLPELTQDVDLREWDAAVALICENDNDFIDENDLKAAARAIKLRSWLDVQDDLTGHNNLTVLGFSLSENSIKRLVDMCGVVSPFLNENYDRYYEFMFKTRIFSPTSGGTASQCVTPYDPNDGTTSSAARHDYQQSVNDMYAGFLLVPSDSVTYNPHYVVDSMSTRRQAFVELSRKYRAEPR